MQSRDVLGAEPKLPVDKEPFSVNTRRPPKELEAALGLLGKNDDTSRFVGLALLKSVLEQELDQTDVLDRGANAEITKRSWEAIPARFLDRLLKARPKEGRTKREASNMVGLAVAVLQAFMGLLESPHTDEKFLGLVPNLMSILHSSPPDIREHIMEVVHCLALTPEGRLAIFQRGFCNGNREESPSTYLLLATIHADIISTIPYLQGDLNSDDYAKTSTRLARGYDVVSAFVAYLIKGLDTDGDGGKSFLMPMDLLLKAQEKLTDMMYETIEDLRERYNCAASNATSAVGPHISALPSNGDSSTCLPLTAKNPIDAMLQHDLTLSQIRALSLWLGNEDNEGLRKAAVGIMDVLQAMYHNSDNETSEYPTLRGPVLEALSGVIQTDEGVIAFLKQDWWDSLSTELEELLLSVSASEAQAIAIANILMNVIESEATRTTRKEWLPRILTINDRLLHSARLPHMWNIAVITCDLIICLFRKATLSTKEAYRPETVKLFKRMSDLLENDSSLRSEVNQQVREDLETARNDLIDGWDVVAEQQHLRLRTST